MKRFQKTTKLAKGEPVVECPKCHGSGKSGKCPCGKKPGTKHPTDFITVINDQTGKKERRVRSRCSGESTLCGRCTGLGFLLARK